MDGGRVGERCPAATLCALPEVAEKLRKKFPAIEAIDPAALPKGVSISAIPGLKGGESVMEVASTDGVTQVYTDALFNLPHGPGFMGFMLKVAGSSGGFKMTGVGKLALLADRAAFRAFLAEQAGRKELRRVVVAHGDVLDAEVGSAFARAAEGI
jgi:hypothetical protein